MATPFPKDEIGSYVTLEILKKLHNGDTVQIDYIRSNTCSMKIPLDVIQDGPKANLKDFDKRFHFKAMRDVSVFYLSNITGEEKSIGLQNLKKVKH